MLRALLCSRRGRLLVAVPPAAVTVVLITMVAVVVTLALSGPTPITV